MAPRPAVTRVTLTDYSMSSALIALRRPPAAAPQPAPAPADQYQGAHSEKPQPIRSEAWARAGTDRRAEETSEIRSFPGPGAPWARDGVPFTLAIPVPSQGQARTTLSKFAE